MPSGRVCTDSTKLHWLGRVVSSVPFDSKCRRCPWHWIPACSRDAALTSTTEKLIQTDSEICFFSLTHLRRCFSYSPQNSSPFDSQEEVDFGGNSLAASYGEVLSLDRSVDHVASYSLHHVTAGAAAPLAELRADTVLHVASARRQEGNKAGDELLLDDAGVEEAAWREKLTLVSFIRQ